MVNIECWGIPYVTHVIDLDSACGWYSRIHLRSKAPSDLDACMLVDPRGIVNTTSGY